MKYALTILVMVLLAACGGGGGGDDDIDSGNRGWVAIREPINGDGSYTTQAPGVTIAGNAFVSPADVDCVSVTPVQLTLTWRNESTGQTGQGGIRSFCQMTFLGLQWVSSWAIPAGVIDLQFGDNVIKITAADNAGNRGTGTINVIRLEDLAPPAIVHRSPASDDLDVPINRSIAVTFSEPMRRSSLSNERFTVTDPDGQSLNGFLDYDETHYDWQFDPQFNLRYSTTYTVTISGLVEDQFGGNLMGSDVTWSFTTAPNPDVTPPQVAAVSPEPGSTCVAPDAKVIATFDEPLDSSTVSRTTFTLVDAAGAAVDTAVSHVGTTPVLDPLLPLAAGSRYEARLTTGIRDLAGNALAADFAWSFTAAITPAIGSWSATSLSGAPFERLHHTATWTGSEMIVFGGHGFDPGIGAFVDTNTGGRYDPVTDTWSAMSTAGVPAMSGHTAVMAGNEMLAWGGNTDTGFRYDPGTDAWTAISTSGAPAPRRAHAAAWTGTEMIVWGGASPGDVALNSGARYDPMTDTWTPMSIENAPSPRVGMAFAWTGTEFIVWGGVDSPIAGSELADGARYDPATDTWTPMSPSTTQRGLGNALAVWTGTEVLVWDGGWPSVIDGNGFPVKTPTLRFYDPRTDGWRETASLCEPFLGTGDTQAHWTGARLFAWSNDENGGYFYDPASDSWEAIDSRGGPPARSGTASVWAGQRFILWGGQERFGLQDSGYVFQE